MTAIALTIAGSDSGGGAGIQADLKTFSARGVYGASVLTALTAQNTHGVNAIHDVPAEFVTAQLDAVFSDLSVNAVKIGMLSQPNVIVAIAEALERYQPENIVLDPVMVAASGDPLLSQDAVAGLVEKLFPRADLITPNLHEAGWILNCPVAQSEAEMASQARRLVELGARAVLLKGGHGEGVESADLLLFDQEIRWYRAPRHDTRNTHGTGCTLSSAIAAELAKNVNMADAVFAAKNYVSEAIKFADDLKIGGGHGPVHHFYAQWLETHNDE